MCRRNSGFTLVELLVVLGIIALLMAMLMPSLARAREQAKQVQCMSNLRQVGAHLIMYANSNKGWMYPPRLGANLWGANREKRWPVHVFGKWNPPVMICPVDIEPAEEHSYLLNNLLFERGIKYGDRDLGGLSPSELILMGEKSATHNDYYMNTRDLAHLETSDLYRGKVDFYKHGLKRGSNYLFFDLHVGMLPVKGAATQINPWGIESVEETD